ncbi:uncharacterized protein LOC134741932 isoform X1 [Cydia strobilella]|uniref:uncharacterized protein LOC134741932 isoform X1 n=1 Tax=Cydia strobilella TaxID=1100964 RepID=UPI0030060DAF
MSLSGLAFLFDIIVEDLRSFVPTKKFVIRSQFADIFSLVLKNPEPNLRKRKRKKALKDKTKAKDAKKATDRADPNKKSQKGQTILFVGHIDTLMAHMMQYPMEICLCSEYNPEERIGSTLIPWNNSFIEYMMSLYHEANPASANVRSVYNIFNEATSKRMAAIRLNIKLRITDHVNLNQYTALSNRHPSTFIKIDIDQLYIDQSTNTRHLSEGTGTIKTIYSDGKKKKRSSIKKRNAKREANIAKIAEERDQKCTHAHPKNKVNKANKIHRNLLLHLTRSDTNIVKPLKLDQYIIKNLSSKSCTAIKQINLFDYIFGDRSGPFGNKTYTVGYATVDVGKNKSKTPSASSASRPGTESPVKTTSKSSTSLDHNLTTTVKCDTLSCVYKKERPLLEKPDDRILLNITSVKHSCCVTDTIERKMEIIDGEKIKDPCYCACECTFGFERKTTYCKICKGYEKRGEDLDGKPQYLMPDPCPVYHKISRIKTGSTSGSDSKRETKKKVKSPEPEKVENKENKKKKNDRFKFNYGYKGIPPKIGHDQCVLPCTGTMSNVPKYMGWLWTADNVPGLMFRPSWKPGAINKVVARKLRNALHPGEVISKRRKAAGLKKRPLKRPLLVVHKKDGEFTVTMESMKTYNKPRTINQQPYEDKPVLTYTIGRTEEENRERRKKKERAARRLEREQREFIQSAFTDMCKEICLKTYQQALGILPDAEDPECACYPTLPDPNRVNEDRSCSCSDDGDSLASDTDSDEWLLEFTPPNAYFDPKYQGTKVKTVDNESQYTYLDYRVKLFDRFGNSVPRFFKGPDGKEQCSDLGGFWSPDHNWLQINVDGFIGADGRWAPFTFIGPSGEQVDTDTGKFQDTKGNWLVVGVDGYIDGNNKWKFYKKPVGKKQGTKNTKRKYSPARTPKTATDNKDKAADKDESLPTFSCFGDASPVDLSRMGIVGHGPDKKLLNKMLKNLIGKGVKVKIPQTTRVPKSPATGRSRQRQRAARGFSDSERSICRHPKPSHKGVIENLDGSRSYFRTSEFKNRSPKARIHDLEQQGRSLSTFHEPCFHSNIDCKKRREGRRVVVMMPHAHNRFT